MIIIRKAKVEDVKEIQDVFYYTWLATYPNDKFGINKEDIVERFRNRFSDETIAKRTVEILDDSGRQLFLVAEDDNKIIGVCLLSKEERCNQLQAIYVLPEYQGKGIGQMFWTKIKEFFSEEKDIVVEVAEYNEQAISFYKKLGFIDTGKRFSEEKHRMPVSGNSIPEMEMVIKAKDDISHTQLLPHQILWGEKFESEKSKLQNIFGEAALGVEHIGSTSIEGLPSKPIIDIGVLIAKREEGDKFIEPLSKLGYWYDQANSSGERHFFRKGNPTQYHLSIAYTDKGSFWDRQLAFRDYLREHPEERERYAALKQELIQKDPIGKGLYIEGKTEFVSEILDKAGFRG